VRGDALVEGDAFADTHRVVQGVLGRNDQEPSPAPTDTESRGKYDAATMFTGSDARARPCSSRQESRVAPRQGQRQERSANPAPRSAFGVQGASREGCQDTDHESRIVCLWS
jgi:hypothetical protein